ncbi:MAG: hypothetical protein WAT53_04505 [Nitrosomonas sp.]
MNKSPRRKQRGIKSTLQAAGFQPASAPRGEEFNPEEIKNGKYHVFMSAPKSVVASKLDKLKFHYFSLGLLYLPQKTSGNTHTSSVPINRKSPNSLNDKICIHCIPVANAKTAESKK